MTIEIGALIAICGLLLTAAAFFIGRISAAKNDGEWHGRLDATLEHIQKGLQEIKNTMTNDAERNRESLRRVHERMDAHMRDDHGKEVPRRNDG